MGASGPINIPSSQGLLTVFVVVGTVQRRGDRTAAECYGRGPATDLRV